MALVIGTNVGFVTTAPTADPLGTATSIKSLATAVPDTSPSGDNIITEIGFWASINDDGDYEIGIYEDSGSGYPSDAVSIITGQTTSGTPSWQVVSGLNISINASTVYWIAVESPNTSINITTDFATIGGTGRSAYTTEQLDDPWNSTNTGSSYRAFYALTEAAPTGTNMQINIGDVWKSVAGMQINIGDSWKTVAGAQINIGDAWKTIF